MSDAELCYLSATEVLARYKAHSVSPVEYTSALIARIEALDSKINAMPMRYFDEALEAAKRAEAKYMKTDGRLRKLEGLPIAVKDETALKGRRTTQASLLYADHVDDHTNPSAERFLRAGPIVLGRTATPEFCCTGFCHSRLWGVTRNPWNLDYTPGGSSGGSGAALAAGYVPLANGSDIGGSIRIPASASGVVGFKPPFGRNPDDPPYNLDWYNHIGPMARSVADCALFQNLMSGPHPRDIATVRPKLRIPDTLKDIKGWKIAYSIDLDVYTVDPEVRANTLAAVEAFRALGCSVDEVKLDWGPEVLTQYWHHFGAIFGPDAASAVAGREDELCAYTRDFIRRTDHTTVADFVSCLNTEAAMYATLGPILENYRVLLCPTLAVPSVGAEHDVTDPDFAIDGVKVDAYLDWAMTPPFNMLARCPVLNVPSGRASNGVPTGLQIVGRTYDDVSVFRAGAAFERLNPWYASAENRPSL
jgi:amidase